MFSGAKVTLYQENSGRREKIASDFGKLEVHDKLIISDISYYIVVEAGEKSVDYYLALTAINPVVQAKSTTVAKATKKEA